MTPFADPLVPVLSGDVGTMIQSVIIDAFNTVNGVSTMVETLEFDNDSVVSVVDSSLSGNPVATVTFRYETEITTVIGGGGGSGPAPTPEPSSLLLLGTGLLGLTVLTRRRKRLG